MSEWISVKDRLPDVDRILVYGDGEIFICEMIVEKDGHSYISSDWEHGVGHRRMPDWIWWMPLPKPPEEK